MSKISLQVSELSKMLPQNNPTKFEYGKTEYFCYIYIWYEKPASIFPAMRPQSLATDMRRLFLFNVATVVLFLY